mmetsp:Transcript_3115/g.8681  ORF Transcript_3115/g.8681 Transcript_3115/m.8681 type:complete len:272 (-) Transcript_3115:25-840(-)
MVLPLVDMALRLGMVRHRRTAHRHLDSTELHRPVTTAPHRLVSTALRRPVSTVPRRLDNTARRHRTELLQVSTALRRQANTVLRRLVRMALHLPVSMARHRLLVNTVHRHLANTELRLQANTARHPRASTELRLQASTEHHPRLASMEVRLRLATRDNRLYTFDVLICANMCRKHAHLRIELLQIGIPQHRRTDVKGGVTRFTAIHFVFRAHRPHRGELYTDEAGRRSIPIHHTISVPARHPYSSHRPRSTLTTTAPLQTSSTTSSSVPSS